MRRRRFAWYLDDHHGDGRIAVACKAKPDVNDELVRADPGRYFLPSYVGRRGWLGVWLDVPNVDWDEAAELMIDAYRLVAPKRLTTLIEQSTR